jgi:hypothetical protein
LVEFVSTECRYNWGGDIAQMYRIQMDHIPFWNFGPSAAGEGYGTGTKNIIDYMGDLHHSKYVRPHAWMDPDFLETMFEPYTMNFTNSRTEFSFWSLWSAPLLMATHPANLSDEKRRHHEPRGDRNQPGQAVHRRGAHPQRQHHYRRPGVVPPAAERRRRRDAVQLGQPQRRDGGSDLAGAGLGLRGPGVHPRPVAQKTVGTQTQGVESVLAAHDVSMLRLTRVDSKK